MGRLDERTVVVTGAARGIGAAVSRSSSPRARLWCWPMCSTTRVRRANISAYVASKWGLRGLTKTAALEFARDGVWVCSVHPGPIHTPMTAVMDESVAVHQPIARFGEPDEVAKMVLFLIADATYSTGTECVVDGGATAGFAITIPE